MTEAMELRNADINNKLQMMEERLSELVDAKVEQAFNKTCEKVEKSYVEAVAIRAPNGADVQKRNEVVKKDDHNISKSFRIQGIEEDPKKNKTRESRPNK